MELESRRKQEEAESIRNENAQKKTRGTYANVHTTTGYDGTTKSNNDEHNCTYDEKVSNSVDIFNIDEFIKNC